MNTTQEKAAPAGKSTPRVPAGYKQTEVGVIPEDWEVRELGGVAAISTGSTPPTQDRTNYGDEFMFASPSDLGVTKHVRKTGKMLSRKGFALSRRFPKDSILFVCIGSTIGKCGIAAEDLTANQQINAILPNSEISSEFLFYASLAFAGRVKEQAGEQAVPMMNKSQFAKTIFPLPPTLAEQQAIATALSDADALIDSLEQLIAKKRLLKQGAMQDLLTGKKRLPGFEGEWEVKRLGALGSTYGGLTGKTKRDFGDGNARYVPFLNVIQNVVIDFQNLERVIVSPGESQNRVRKGDLLFNGSSETPEEVALSALVPEDHQELYLNSFCFGFRFTEGQESSGLYLAYFFRSRPGRDLLSSLAQGATRYNMSKAAFLNLSFPLPILAEQTALEAILSDMDAGIAALEAKLAKARQLKQGMMQELLTGKTRLV
jgi:type I restriction enzyme S subunit